MNKKVLYAITVIIVLIILIILFVVLKDDSIVGVYYSDNWTSYKPTATFVINNDNTCEYPDSSYSCKWEKNGDNYLIISYDYLIDSKGQFVTIGHYKTLDECEEVLKGMKESYELDPICQVREFENNVILIDDGLLMNDKKFEKVKDK